MIDCANNHCWDFPGVFTPWDVIHNCRFLMDLKYHWRDDWKM